MVAYSYKRFFRTPLRMGLGLEPVDRSPGARKPKNQTIRAIGKRRHARPGDELQHYIGMRTKQCELIGRARCTASLWIIIWFGSKPGDMTIQIEGRGILTPRALRRFAQDDGFYSPRDMWDFWMEEHGTKKEPLRKWRGVLIMWKPIEGKANDNVSN